jgi:hypothetical protein
MRRPLPSKSPVWWVVIICSLAAFGVFMVFEVLDLDGSDLCKRIFWPPISSQPAVAEAEGVMRHRAFAAQVALGHVHALVLLRQPFTGFSRCPHAAPAIFDKRLKRIRPRTDIHRASFPPPAPSDEPPSISALAI